MRNSFRMDLFFILEVIFILLFYININLKIFLRIGSQMNVYIARIYYRKCFTKSDTYLWQWLFPGNYFCLNGIYIAHLPKGGKTRVVRKGEVIFKRIKYINKENHFSIWIYPLTRCSTTFLMFWPKVFSYQVRKNNQQNSYLLVAFFISKVLH